MAKVKSTVRRQLVGSSKGLEKVSSLTSVHSKQRGKPHRHFCSDRECRLFYEDNCDTPETNGPCQLCRGTTRSHASVMDPVECCINNCVQVVRPDELERYSLAGPGPWFQCLTCRRTHGWPCTTP